MALSASPPKPKNPLSESICSWAYASAPSLAFLRSKASCFFLSTSRPDETVPGRKYCDSPFTTNDMASFMSCLLFSIAAEMAPIAELRITSGAKKDREISLNAVLNFLPMPSTCFSKETTAFDALSIDSGISDVVEIFADNSASAIIVRGFPLQDWKRLPRRPWLPLQP